MEGLRRLVGVDKDAALRRGLSEGEKAVAHPLVEVRSQSLVAIGHVAATAQPLLRHRWIQVEDDGQIRSIAADNKASDGSDPSGVNPLATALIDGSGIGKTIGDHPLPRRQRRPDRLVQVLAAGGEVQQGFGLRRPSPVMPAEQQRTNGFRLRGATRLTGQQHLDPPLAKLRCEQAGLGGFSRPLPAFEADEQRLLSPRD